MPYIKPVVQVYTGPPLPPPDAQRLSARNVSLKDDGKRTKSREHESVDRGPVVQVLFPSHAGPPIGAMTSMSLQQSEPVM
jgi:hypothetical protein